MLYETPMIVWHGQGLHSCDFDPRTGQLITAGIQPDHEYLRMWKIVSKGGQAGDSKQQERSPCSQLLTFDLYFEGNITSNFSYPCNMVRFAPNGEMLGVAGDEEKVEILVRRIRPREFGKGEMQMGWGAGKTLRGHLDSVLSMSWSACSTYLATGSVDNTVIIWNAQKGQLLQRIEGIRGFVNGVAFDPLCEFLTVQANDKTLRVYRSNVKKTPRFYPLYSHSRVKEYSMESMQFLDDLDENKEEGKREHEFLLGEQKFKHFYRRLEWAPDGSFFVTTGTFYQNEHQHLKGAAYIFIRQLLEVPLLAIGDFRDSVTCVRFCKCKFKYNPEHFKSQWEEDRKAPKGLIKLEHAFVFALATAREILIFSTASSKPVVRLEKQHYLSIQDMAWEGCSKLIIVSLDGYATVVQFKGGFFGEVIEEEGESEKEEKQAEERKEEKKGGMVFKSKKGKTIDLTKISL